MSRYFHASKSSISSLGGTWFMLLHTATEYNRQSCICKCFTMFFTRVLPSVTHSLGKTASITDDAPHGQTKMACHVCQNVIYSLYYSLIQFFSSKGRPPRNQSMSTTTDINPLPTDDCFIHESENKPLTGNPSRQVLDFFRSCRCASIQTAALSCVE